MDRLTDIRHPERGLRPKEPFGKKFKAVLMAPFIMLKNGFVAFFSGLKRFFRSLWPRGLASWIVIFLILIFLWQVWSSWNFPMVDKNKWQAVFLSNNQVFFGHLKEINSGYVLLEEVYYLRPTQGTTGNVDLVKLGDELHGPESNMYIPKDQIIFWENLKPDSQVTQVISRIRNR